MIHHRLAFLFLAAIVASCAQVHEPQGGPRDSTPPALTASEPANGSARFTGRRIVLHFSERVKLVKGGADLLVSPPLHEKPLVQVLRGSDVSITLQQDLKANTTYTFNVGEIVTDLAEGNPATGLSFVVSTGDQVDSLSVSGRVLEAADGQPAAGVLVLLYAAGDTGDVRTVQPAYFARSDAAGQFQVTHLGNAPFRIRALRDQNANFRFDLPNEEVAFEDTLISPGVSGPLLLRLFHPLAKQQYIVDARVNEDRGWRFALARPAQEFALRSLDREGGALHWWPEWNTGRDTVVMWPSDTAWLKDQRFQVLEAGEVLDTATYRPRGPMPFNLTVAVQRDPETGQFQLTTSRPVETIRADRAAFTKDTLQPGLQRDSLDHRMVHLMMGHRITDGAELLLLPHTLTDALGGTNDTTRLKLGVPDPGSLGRSEVEVLPGPGVVVNGPFILQLLSSQGRVVREVTADSLPAKVRWSGIQPGAYGLRLIEDVDRNGKWTTGSFQAHGQPERVHVLREPVTIRAGWVVQTVWGLTDAL